MDGFESHDWSSDEGWQRVLQNIDITSTDPTVRARLLRKRQLKYYAEHVDPSFNPSARHQQQQQQQQEQRDGDGGDGERPSGAASTQGPTPRRGVPFAVWLEVGGHVIVLLFALTVLVPVGSAAGQFSPMRGYSRCLRSAAMLAFVVVFRRMGKPQMSKEYLAQAMQLEEAQFIIYCLILMMSDTWAAETLVPRYLPATVARTVLLKTTRVSREIPRVRHINAMLEVWAGIVLLVWIAMPFRQLSVAFAYWYLFLRLRYIISPISRAAFAEMRLTIRSKLPAFALSPYDRLCDFLHGQADMHRQQQQQANSRCSIM